MKKILLGTLLALALIAVTGTAQAQTIPQLLPNSAWCVGTGQPGTNQVTLIATQPHNHATYCVTVDVGDFGNPYEITDLSVYGWDNDFHINTVWNGPTTYGDYFVNTGLTGPFSYIFGGEHVNGMNGLGISSLKAWHE